LEGSISRISAGAWGVLSASRALTLTASRPALRSVTVPSPVWATSVYAKRNGRWMNVVYEHTPAKN